MERKLRRAFSPIYTLDEWLSSAGYAQSRWTGNPEDVKIVSEVLNFIVIPQKQLNLSPSSEADESVALESFEKFLSSLRMPVGPTARLAELHSSKWRALDRIVGRKVLTYLFKECIILKPGSSSSPWLQLTGPSIAWFRPPPASHCSVTSSEHQVGLPMRKNVEKGPLILRRMPIGLPLALRKLGDMVVERAKRLPPSLAARACPSARRWRAGDPPWTPPKEANRFLCQTILRRLCPRALLGSSRNWEIFYTHVHAYVSLGRGYMTLTQACFGLRASETKWRPHELQAISWWLLVEVVQPVVAWYFWVTDTSFDPAGAYLCVRRPVWQQFATATRRQLEVAIDARNARRRSDMPISDLRHITRSRVVPKSNGTGRIVTNMRAWRPALQTSHAILRTATVDSSIASSSYAAASLNASERSDSSSPTAPPVPPPLLPTPESQTMTPEQVTRTRLTCAADAVPAITRFASSAAALSVDKLWVVQADLAEAYDHADTEMLRDLLKASLLDEQFVVRDSWSVRPGPRHFRNVRRVLACRSSDSFTTLANGCDDGAILIEDRAWIVDGSTVVDTVDRLLGTQELAISGGRVAQRGRGIPQGASISQDLCDCLLDALVATQLGSFRDHRKHLLLRYVDDFLFVSIERSAAIAFAAAIQTGFPAFGAKSNPAKIHTNIYQPLGDITYLGHWLSLRGGSIQVMPSLAPIGAQARPVSMGQVFRRLAYEIGRLSYPLRLFRPPTTLVQDTARAVGFILSRRLMEMNVPSHRQDLVVKLVLQKYLRGRLQRHSRAIFIAYRRSQRQYINI